MNGRYAFGEFAGAEDAQHVVRATEPRHERLEVVRIPTHVSVSELFDGTAVTLFDGSHSRSDVRPARMGMGSGNQRAIT